MTLKYSHICGLYQHLHLIYFPAKIVNVNCFSECEKFTMKLHVVFFFLPIT